MKEINKTTKVVTERGTVLNLTVTAKRGWEEATEPVWVDESINRTSKKEINETTIVLEANGQEFTGSFSTFVPDKYKKQGVYALFASKIGVSRSVYDALIAVVNDAIKEAETDENWKEFQTLRAQSLKAEEEYQRHHRAVEKMMTSY
jgi:hypothetical protein